MAAAVSKVSAFRTRLRAEAPSRSSASCSPSCSGFVAPASRAASVRRAAKASLQSRANTRAGWSGSLISTAAAINGVLAEDEPLDAFFAGDSAEARSQVAAFLESLGLRPLDAGGLEMTCALEWAGVLLVGVARNGAGFDLALGAEAR